MNFSLHHQKLVGVSPVSYTHLDVYKRQVQDPIFLGKSLNFESVFSSKINFLNNVDRDMKKVATHCICVEQYVNLDAYSDS